MSNDSYCGGAKIHEEVAHTIADLAGDDHIRQPHLYEAISYRTLDRTLRA